MKCQPWTGIIAAASLVVALLGACAANPRANPTGSGGTATALHGPTGSGGAGGVPFATSGMPPCNDKCSANLRHVLDCHGHVTDTCAEDEGCGSKGKCVAACEAAEENHSTLGCEFFSVIPGPETFTRGSCFAAFIANTWDLPVTIAADYGGMPLDMTQVARIPIGTGPSTTYAPLANGQLDPGEIAILFLASTATASDTHKVQCPAAATPLAIDPSIDLTGRGTAFHITTTAPVVAYDMYPYGGAASEVGSATLLLPTPAWGTNFIASDAYPWDPESSSAGPLYPHLQIVAAEDGTSVTISPTADIQGGTGVAAAPKGAPVVYTVNRGEVLQFMQQEELAGSAIASDKPIGVWGGAACMRIHLGESACDSGHQQLAPIQLLGNDYAAVRYRNRASKEEQVPWTITGVATTTTMLTYEPNRPTGAPAKLESGQVVEFDAAGPFRVLSQDADHPFHLAIHMTGGDSAAAAADGQGDPEYLSVVPGQQYLSRYLFMTDPTYATTSLVFVRTRASTDATFEDVTLDCAGKLTGWQPVGTSGLYEYVIFDLLDAWAPQGACDNGVHLAESGTPFGLTVWGWDLYTSYAYPAGMGVKALNKVIVPPK